MPGVSRTDEKEVSILFPPEATTRDMASSISIYRKKKPEGFLINNNYSIQYGDEEEGNVELK